MKRVIQDSDDELDEEGLEGGLEDAPQQNGASPIALGSATVLPGNATGSTESLNNAFQAAHRAQFYSQMNGSMPSFPPPPDGASPQRSLSQDRNKRRKISADASQNESLCASNNAWGLKGTIQEDYAQHEPMAMFPEPSSTIPYTTLTQERLLAEVMAPEFLGIEAEPEPEAPRYQPRNSSVPWSELLKTQSEDNGTPPEQDTSHAPTSSRHEGGSDRSSGAKSKSRRLSQRSRRDSSVRLKGSPLRNEVFQEETVSPNPTLSNLINTQDPASNTSNAIQLSQSPSVKQKRQSSPGIETMAQITLSRKPPKAKPKAEPTQTSDDYLEDIGLPKEQYKPRPSRSRSLKSSLVEPTDYSVRPEAAARRGARRCKTTGDTRDGFEAITPEKIEQICAMGFTPTTTQVALEKHNGDVTQTIDWLLANVRADDQDELAPPRIPKTKTRTHKNSTCIEPATRSADIAKERIISQEDGSVPEDARADEVPHLPLKTTNTSPTKVEVVIPLPSGPAGSGQPTNTNVSGTTDPTDNAPGQRVKRKKSTLDMPESTQELDQDTAPEPAKQKKRGRGRPKSEPVAPLSVVYEESPGKLDEDTTLQSECIPPKDAKEQVKPAAPTVSDMAPTSPLKAVVAPAEPTKTPEKQTKGAQGVRSPVSKGKATYRVGLSKRARIAPLLKMVKK